MRIRQAAIWATLALAPAVLAGCGGGGGGSTSPFNGVYSGTFTATDPQGSQSGTVSALIDPSGGLKGQAVNTTSGATAALSGSISAGGQLQSTYLYPGGVKITANGQVTRTAAGHLTATLPEVLGGQTIGTVSLDLARQ